MARASDKGGHGRIVVFCPQSKVFLVLASILTVPPTCAQIKTGTIIVIGYSKNQVIIAADSRECDGYGRYRDEACKITALDNKVIFTAGGKAKNIRGGVALWDATREARTALAVIEPVKTDVGGSFLDRLAEKWGNLLGDNIAKNIQRSELVGLPDDGTLVDGFFIGFDESRELHISHEKLRFIPTARGIKSEPVKVVTLPDVTRFVPIGEADVVIEFQKSESKRAKKWQQGLVDYAKSAGLTTNEARAIWLVHLTGLYGKETVPGNPDVHLVGGGIDAIELTRRGSLKWIRRKQNCPVD